VPVASTTSFVSSACRTWASWRIVVPISGWAPGIPTVKQFCQPGLARRWKSFACLVAFLGQGEMALTTASRPLQQTPLDQHLEAGVGAMRIHPQLCGHALGRAVGVIGQPVEEPARPGVQPQARTLGQRGVELASVLSLGPVLYGLLYLPDCDA
jgi:hypothetical protein